MPYQIDMPISEDEWQNNIIAEQSGVRLIEVGVGVYLVEYPNSRGLRQRSPLFVWAEAEANFVRRVEEEDYR